MNAAITEPINILHIKGIYFIPGLLYKKMLHDWQS